MGRPPSAPAKSGARHARWPRSRSLQTPSGSVAAIASKAASVIEMRIMGII
jgi:hypothetical protein